MANTWVVVKEGEELEAFRSTDFDSTALRSRYGTPLDVFDKTDGMRHLVTLTQALDEWHVGSFHSLYEVNPAESEKS